MQGLLEAERPLAFNFWGRENEAAGESKGGLLARVSVAIEGMSVQRGHCLCLDCHRVGLSRSSWSSSNTARTAAVRPLSEVEKGAGMSRHFSFRSSSSTCSARSTRRLSHSVVSYGQSRVSSLVRKTDRARKTPWKLSVTRKANARARLKKVDAVIEAVRASGVECKALVSIPPPRLGPVALTRPRTAPCSCPRNTKWSQKINTPSSAQRHVGIERVFTRCPNGQGYVPISHWWNALLTIVLQS